ncbi:MAG: DUF1735 domain-containing protein [Ferruginibacter sp.]
MKFSNIKKLVLPLVAAALFNACDKPDVAEQLADNGQQIIKIAAFGGLQDPGFGASNLVFDPASTSEMVELQLEFSTSQVSTNDITVTLEVDPAGVTRYNATQANVQDQYEILPATAFTFPSTQVLIKAGETLSEPFSVEFDPSMIDPSKNLMLPISITAISGAAANVKAAPGTGTAYLHFIGNPLAGNYNTMGHRTNYTGGVSWAGPPDPEPAGGVDGTTAVYSTPKFAAPIDSHTFQLDMGNVPDPAGGLAQYYITANTDYTDITFDQGPTFEAGYSNILRYHEFTPAGPGTPASFRLVTKYNNTTGGAGNDRIVDQTFTHQ